MAFGFGFNKQKVLSAAEKFVQQGKLQNAIAEYEKVLRNDEKDLTVNNTIGDLYARLGDSEKAIECFKKVGDAYAAQGFTVKGIAMYKKITKLQPSVDSSLKLAELYTQQGLFNDARAQYLQVAEDFMKAGDLDQAVRLFQKVLEMDPENVPMRVKLAEVYVRLGKKKEAWEIFSAAAESLRARGSLAAAEDLLKRMLVLEPGSSYVLLLRGKAALEADDPKSAIEYLEKAADLDSHPDGLRDLLRAYLKAGNLVKSAPIAEKLLTVHNDPQALFLLAEGCARLGQYREALEIYTRHCDRLLATDSTKLLGSLHTMITHVRDDAAALDSLLLLLNKAGESTHVNEVTELLAHASVKDGNLARARDLYQMLATTEPQNQLHMQNYQQVLSRMDDAAPSALGITAEEGAVIAEELEAIAPVIDQAYPDDVAIAVRSAVTDADLFLSYNLPDKAVVPLLGVLAQAPRDARLNQRLAALHTRFHRFTEAAVCCRTLESVYHDAGFPDEAMRYGELAARYEQSAGAGPSSPGSLAAASEVASPALASSPAARSAAVAPAWHTSTASAGEAGHTVHPEFAVQHPPDHDASTHDLMNHDLTHHDLTHHDLTHHDLTDHDLSGQGPAAPASSGTTDAAAEANSDLASEWENSLTVDEDSPVAEAAAIEADQSVNPEIAETVEEIRFYLEHFMTDQAHAGFEKLESLTSDSRILDPLRAAMAGAGQPQADPEPEIAEINADEINADEINAGEISAGEISADEPAAFEVQMEAQPASEFSTSPDLVTYHQEAQGQIHHEVPVESGTALEPAHAGSAPANELNAFVADLEASLGDSFPKAAPPPPGKPVLPGWPVAKARAAAKKGEPETEPVAPEPVGQFEEAHAKVEIPPALPFVPQPQPAPTVAASAGGSATAAVPARSKAARKAPAVKDAPANASTMSYSPAAVRPLGAGAQAMHPSGSIDLSEMFGELKQELEEEVIAGDDDPETHYNLGVAFREMGLLDEAIAELQKVCTAIERGHAFAQPVQTYTWLAQCFLDKGVPEAAIRWYEKALSIPGLDAEARLAIHYELGSACESAEDKPAALRHFTSVYGTNIDYRDVAERIQALKS
jgi:tetratricopeptide (TPR) repeat protein